MTKFSNTATCKKHGKKKTISNKLTDLAKEISRKNVKMLKVVFLLLLIEIYERRDKLKEELLNKK